MRQPKVAITSAATVDDVEAAFYEALQNADIGPRHPYVVATNVHQQTAKGWRTAAHHASPGIENEPHVE